MWSVLTSHHERDESTFYESGVRDIESILEEVGELVGCADRRSALDFGCGMGRLTFALGGHFEKVVGVDISTRMLELARTHPNRPANVEFMLNSGAKLTGLDDDTYDLVVSLIVLQHVPVRYAMSYLQEFLRVTRPGGVVVFQATTERKRIETGSFRLWTEKPLRWDDPPIWRLCYRASSRSFRWIHRRLRQPFLSNETRYRLGCVWRKVTGQPFMQMNCLPERKIDEIVRNNGCEILRMRNDHRTGEAFTSRLFFVRKK